jgi:antirestriction protein ArdC
MNAKDLYAEVTASIVTSLEAGGLPWWKPWAGGTAFLPLRHNGVA